MLSRCLVVSTLLVVACGPGGREDDDGTTPDAQVTPPDAQVFADGPPVTPQDFTVYAHSRDTLYKLDPTTLDPIVVGPFNAPGGDLITDLAVAPDGTLFVISKTTLYTADATDGHVTFRAAISSGPAAGNVGLTTLPTGELLATDSTGGVRKINTQTGAVTEIGAFGGGFATAGDLVAVESGTMYGLSDKGPAGTEFDSNLLIVVNTSNGSASAVGTGIGYAKTFGAAFVGGKLLAFTSAGEIVEVSPTTGAGTLKKSTGLEFWGAGVSSLVPGVD